MSNINYNALNQSIQRHDSSYYQPIILPDPLERYGSAHLDQDIFGISVSRSTKDQQMGNTLIQTIIVSKLIYKEGILVVMMSTFGLFCLLFYTLQKKFPFSGAFPFVCSLGSICLSSLWFRHLYEMDPLEIIFPIAVSSLTCIYVILELYFIMKNVMSEDYILANIYLFVDFVYPIRFIHHFCELTDNMNVFPEILYPGDV
ncbi:hypothetical protein BCV72DRAFT_208717 [Rhizopus microsporus var. microsporus]|uniref:Uncharacterized protein n=1 Tax=Rhizopus microsporus var. microsporus TaxID=86635 RepID=A0A1X0R140_RHIZD|nr:hypothetical protein BCV72DRAFT_208717 [Rhizopus microsporus var. microsporus]